LINTPLVSIGMPVYSRPNLIRRAIISIISQTYGNLEIIISNDFSPDPEVYKILEEYAARDVRIKLTHQTEDLGCYGNYQWVLQQATGKYFMYAQEDDIWDSEFIEEMVKILESNPEDAVAISAARYFGEHGTYGVYTFDKSIYRMMIGEELPFVWMGLWKLDELKLFDYDSDGIYGKDIGIVTEALLSRKWGYSNKILYHKTLDYDKAFRNAQNYPFCLLEMYKYIVGRIFYSKHISDENKLKSCVVLPIIFLRILLTYLVCIIYITMNFEWFRTKANLAFNRLCIHD
jgi:glycosyltransferase involved in cell wall biosynthesis